MNLAQGLFMAEAEGYLDTHESKVQRMLKDIQRLYNEGCGKLTVGNDYLSQFGLTFEELSGHDLRRMALMAENGRL